MHSTALKIFTTEEKKMFKAFSDPNQEKMDSIAKTIKPSTTTEYHAAEAAMPRSPVASPGGFLKDFNPFPQPEINIHNLSTEELVENLAGKSPLNDRFRAALQAQYPLTPQLWSLKPPMPAMDTSTGNSTSRWLDGGAKADGGGTLLKSYSDLVVDEICAQAMAKGINVVAMGSEVLASLKAMAQSGRIRLTESAGRQSIEVVR